MVRMVNNTTYKKNEMTLPRKPMYNERDVRLLLMSGFSPSKCDRIDERINNSAIKEARGDNTTIAHAPSGWVTIVVSKSCVHGPTSSTTSRIHSCSSPNQVCSSACVSPSRQVPCVFLETVSMQETKSFQTIINGYTEIHEYGDNVGCEKYINCPDPKHILKCLIFPYIQNAR